ncbi:MAG TPA: DUF6084 family protein [Tepidisphaeraceae bacterium]|jgi:hypothetical protein|nr:DUF6084 family protein [Tepidisphaeraceae bacterium]
MPDLDFFIDRSDPVPYAAAPQLAFGLRIIQRPPAGQSPQAIHSVTLRCQIRLEPTRRRYSPAEQEKLFELFGEPSRWGQTVRSMLWTNAAIVVPAFDEQVSVELPVPCTYDFNIATTKYFHALEDGEIPLGFLFSGTIFYRGEDDSLQVAQISWEKEVNYRMPVAVWKRTMDLYFPNSNWLLLRRDVFDRLSAYKIRRGMTSWEQAVESLLAEAEQSVSK